MACNHRFLNELIPNWEIDYLFIGTFNPEWDNERNNAIYFYGRPRNDFWYIMPQVFGDIGLKEHQNNKECLIGYLKSKKIGLTDLVKSLKNTDQNNPEHRERVLSYRDRYLENFDIEYNVCEIKNLINKNQVKGVFLTRKIDPKSEICKKWLDIKEFCQQRNVKAAELITPSPLFHKLSKDQKLQKWKEVING